MKNIILPFQPIKGQALKVPFIFPEQTGFGGCNLGTFTTSTHISKDNGSFVDTTNSPVKLTVNGDAIYETRGHTYLQLTAEEMNADEITVTVRLLTSSSTAETVSVTQSIKIYTSSGSSGGATAEEIWEYESRTITGGTVDDSSSDQTSAVISSLVAKGYTINVTARDESGYNYYGLTSDNIWYVIIKEKTDYSTVEYYMNSERRVAYATAWAGRESLVYGDTIKIK